MISFSVDEIQFRLNFRYITLCTAKFQFIAPHSLLLSHLHSRWLTASRGRDVAPAGEFLSGCAQKETKDALLEYLPHNSLRAWSAPFKQTRQVRETKACQCAAVLRLARECTIVAVLSMAGSESGDSMHALRALGIDRATCFVARKWRRLAQFDGIAPLRVEMRHLPELI